MNTLKALKRCALGLDLYLWLTYRTFALRAPLRLTWRHLYHQFDADPSKAGNHDTVQYFRRKVLRELKKIKLAWPGLNYATAPGVLILLPSTPAIPPNQACFCSDNALSRVATKSLSSGSGLFQPARVAPSS